MNIVLGVGGCLRSDSVGGEEKGRGREQHSLPPSHVLYPVHYKTRCKRGREEGVELSLNPSPPPPPPFLGRRAHPLPLPQYCKCKTPPSGSGSPQEGTTTVCIPTAELQWWIVSPLDGRSSHFHPPLSPPSFSSRSPVRRSRGASPALLLLLLLCCVRNKGKGGEGSLGPKKKERRGGETEVPRPEAKK